MPFPGASVPLRVSKALATSTSLCCFRNGDLESCLGSQSGLRPHNPWPLPSLVEHSGLAVSTEWRDGNASSGPETPEEAYRAGRGPPVPAQQFSAREVHGSVPSHTSLGPTGKAK